MIMSDNLPMMVGTTSLVAPAGAHGPVLFRRNSAIRQFQRTARSAAELAFTVADLLADRVIEVFPPRAS
jgi:hypothetical protein